MPVHRAKSFKDDFRTPPYLFIHYNRIFDFEIDAAADSKSSLCSFYFGFDNPSENMKDGLKASWSNVRIFCNPPFSNKKEWIEKADFEVQDNDCPICLMVLPNCIDTKIFNKVIHKRYYWEHLPFRVSFIDPATMKPVNGNDTGTVIIYFKKDIVRPKNI